MALLVFESAVRESGIIRARIGAPSQGGLLWPRMTINPGAARNNVRIRFHISCYAVCDGKHRVVCRSCPISRAREPFFATTEFANEGTGWRGAAQGDHMLSLKGVNHGKLVMTPTSKGL